MRLSPGDKLGAYEIVYSIGKGGMGEVWKAHDPQLGRDVAIKVSAQQFTDRFEREARAIAALNHPNVCTLYHIGPNYLVMEYIEGPTLAERIKEGPVPLEEALTIAKQIADALDAAHEKNIAHRDLKPGNVKIRPDGSVKVLDFGLAKSGAPEAQLSHDSPTLMQSPTQLGVILGTAAYMAPEQARGKIVDKRADIWSFGVVLYEMLTGKRLFEGEDLTETLASVLKSEPNLTPVPRKVRRLLEACLQKDPKKRLRDIGDYWRLLEDEPAVVTPEKASSSRTPWIAAGVFATALALLASAHFRERPPVGSVTVSALLPPEGAEFNFAGGFGLPTLSPDGSRIVFGASSKDGKRMLYARRLDSPAAQVLQGSDDAMFPFWSPDSRWIAFEQNGTLKKIDTQGGPPVTLGRVGVTRGGSWSPSGVILIAAQTGGAILRISAVGGTASEVVSGATGGGTYPWFLPDGHHFLYSVRQPGDMPLRVGSIDEPGKPGRVVAQVHSNAAYSPGHLLYLRDETLMAQPFDAKRLETIGEPVPIAEAIPTFLSPSRPAAFTVSSGGSLVYRSNAAAGGSRLVWKDRQGKTARILGEAKGEVADPALSPDGKRLAVSMSNGAVNSSSSLWVFDIERGVPTRFTFTEGFDRSPVWSPDGSAIYFSSVRSGKADLYRKALNGTTPEELLLRSNDQLMLPTSISPGGAFLIYNFYSEGPAVWFMPLPPGIRETKPEPKPLLEGGFAKAWGVFRPDGHWVAYGSNESGGQEVYIVPFPGPGGKLQVSTGGGTRPQWRRDGKELFYQSLSEDLMAAEIIDKGGLLEIGKVQKLFIGLDRIRTSRKWTASADGQTFILAEGQSSEEAHPLTLVQNWTAGIRK